MAKPGIGRSDTQEELIEAAQGMAEKAAKKDAKGADGGAGLLEDQERFLPGLTQNRGRGDED